ncbi:ArsB/NhaD family transporter [uncultured Selenomonas sp.]|uniref:ArsB/NhaD family transporter n=1 Tax=uncultured Selenomonas sp. TaxID=159275 RepID=UPI001CB530BF|nr:ArsB/NhaD family transporter [uncultured Selenomonas sp.]MBF1687312.1 ArsB/NhaD family transporter [Selenomonas sp.]MBF1695527.1 ArsB/NhaD family transporter [Selenomonas sp.]MBF1703534.1 ArsB/NhaD family transporter [Selenomonas sp.]MBF1705905.1 ArsB/NhaD family transporter [Selenomonas sp.]
MMETATIVAIVIFVVAYALIISEKVHRTIVGLFGAMLMILFGIIDQEVAVHHIDFNTLGLLMGMMIIVNITSETGLFNFLAIWAAQKVKAQPIALLVVLSTITMVCSALLDNVTTVLLTVPITFSITSQLKVDVMPYLISQILASNIGGTATLIGDPPNIMIGSAVGLDFMAFVENLTLISIIIFILVQFILIGLYHKGLHTQPELQDKIMRLPAGAQITDHALLRKCLVVIFLTITFFVLHGSLGLESATVALSGAGLLLLLTATRDEGAIVKVLSKIEWPAIFFFGGLFILVGALVETGVIRMLAAEAIKATGGNVEATAILILWMSAFASAFIDNIPFVATLIPLIQDMGQMGLSNLDPMWWSLALGACLGGNGTLIGASANVVVASMSAQRGRPISFLGFMKVAFPVMVFTIIVSNIYVYIRYL